MEAGVDGAEDVAAVELSGGEEIQCCGEKADPCGAPYRRKQEDVRVDAGMNEGVEEAKKEWDAEDYRALVGFGMSDGWDNAGMNDAIDEGGGRENETDEGAGGANIKERASGANGRAYEYEGAESADERGKRNEEGVAGVNVVVAAGEEMAEFVSEENS